MVWLFALPLAAQGVLMGVDELWFHRQRGLPAWERIGHPLDSLSVLACLCVPWVAPLGAGGLWTYAGLAALSSLLVTKDEVVHARRCQPGEHWIHAVLFVLHPVVLGVVVLLWGAREEHALAEHIGRVTGLALPGPALAGGLLALEGVLVAGFAVYQTLYWNWNGRDERGM